MLLRLERSGGHDRALGMQGWRGASPVQDYSSWLRKVEQDGNESDVEDNEERSAEGEEGQAGAGTASIDSMSSSSHHFHLVFAVMQLTRRPADRFERAAADALILDLARWQLGAAIIAGASFFLTLLELVCV